MLDATCCGLKILGGKSFPNPESWKNWEWEGNEDHYVELRMAGRSQQKRDPGSGLLASPCRGRRMPYTAQGTAAPKLWIWAAREIYKFGGVLRQLSSLVALCELGW